MQNKKSRIICIALLVAMVLAPFSAYADVIAAYNFVDFYKDKTDEAPDGKARVPQQESTLEGGWYYVRNIICSDGSVGAYVRAMSVTVVQSSQTAEPTTDTLPTVAAPTPYVSLAPGVTPSPTPLAGVINPEYTGTVISYTVPAGGLMLYDAKNGKQVESAKANTVLKLTLDPGQTSWYSLYFNGKTYYVPVNALYTDTSVTGTATVPPSVAGSIKSVVVGGSGANYYSSVAYVNIPSGTTTKRVVMVSGSASGFIEPGTRINARYYSPTETDVLIYTLGGKQYYIRSSDIDKSQSSTATVAEKDSTALMTAISFTLSDGSSIDLYREQSTSAPAFVLKNDNSNGSTKNYTLYGESLNNDWYKVTYNSEIFYINKSKLSTDGDATDISVVDSAVNQNAATDTFMVTIGSSGAWLFRTIPSFKAGTTPAPSSSSGNFLNAGKNVLVGPYNAQWYTYTDESGNKFYLYRGNVAEATSTTVISSYKATIYENVTLYDNKQLPTNKQLKAAPTGSVYVLYSVDDKWYSVTYDGASYFVLKVDIEAAMAGYTGTTMPVKTIVISDGKEIHLYPTNTNSATKKTGPVGISVCELSALATHDPEAYAKYSAIGAPANSGGWRYITPDYNYLITHSDVNNLFVTGANGIGQYLREDYRTPITFVVPAGESVAKHKTDGSGSLESIKGPATFTAFEVDPALDPSDNGKDPSDSDYVNWSIGNYAYISADRTFMIHNNDKSKVDEWIPESGSTLERIANVSDGKEYYITIGLSGAQLYSDATLATPVTVFLNAGETVRAKKYTDRLYIVSGYFLSVKDIASIRGGDDAAAVIPTAPEDLISDVAKGQIDTSFQPTVLTYTTPLGGLWLYYNIDAFGIVSNPALVLDANKTVKLSAVPKKDTAGNYIKDSYGNIENWPAYSVWYGGVQYYVPSSSLTISTTDTYSGGTYSIVIDRASVTLYKKYTANPTPANAGIYLTEPVSNNSLKYGMRVNVTIQQYVDPKTKADVLIYRYVDVYGNVYYFYGSDSSGKVNDEDQTYMALVASNADVSLMSRLVDKGTAGTAPAPVNVNVYTSPNDRSGFYRESTPFTAYGVKYNSEWYRIIYGDKVGYVKVGDMVVADQVVVTDGVSSTTYTVIVGTGGAYLYTKPSTNYSNTMKNGQIVSAAGNDNLYRDSFGNSEKLSAGTAVLASRVSSSSTGTGSVVWYSYTHTSGKTLYFMGNTTTVSNASTNASVSSYVVDLSGEDPDTFAIDLYASVSADDPSKTSYKLGPGVYTFRKINSTWSSVYYRGKTYYLKNSQIPSDAMQKSTAIATTSVGNTYAITLGNKAGDPDIIIYSDSTLLNEKQTLPAGTKTTGLKMFVQDQAIDSKQIVFKITYLNGAVGYVYASDVIGVASGDEVAEAKLAEQEASQSGSVALGDTVMQRVAKDELFYQTTSLTAATTQNAAEQVYQMTKFNDSWYSVIYYGTTWYYPTSSISAEKSETGGIQVTVSVGESYNYTFTERTGAFAQPVAPSEVVRTIYAGETHTIKRVSEDFYEVTINSTPYYILALDITLPFIPNTSTETNPGTTPTQIQHDGTGYITSHLMIKTTSGTVNLRKSTSTSSTVLDRIPSGIQVKNNGYVLDASKTVWYSVTYNNQTGFIHGDYVSPVGTVSTSSGGNPANDIGRTLIVNMNDVNVRSGPGPSYSVLTRLAKGYSVVPLTYETGNDGMVWYSFKLSASQTAYIRYDYLDGSAASAEQSGNVAVKAGGTNMRSGPGETFGVVARLARDIIVTIIGTGTDSANNTWYYVTYEGMAGYLRNDLVRPLTESERSALQQSVIGQYIELRSGSKGAEVLALQQQLIKLGYLSSDSADGVYGTKTIEAVTAFQRAKGLTQTGVASASLQATIFNAQNVSGSTTSLDWFSTGFTLINANKSITIYDINASISWNATYINGANHADIIPASKAEADKIKAYNITGSYVRRPIIVTIAGQNYAGSMYAVGHGNTSYCSYFHGVMCIHFTGSKTHGSGNVDSDHQSAIKDALSYANTK